MKKPHLMTEEEKWEAIVKYDQGYRGVFFYGVKTTGVFCHPTCRAKRPARKNTIFFDAVEDALKAGFRPCKRCRPDIADFKPDLELVRQAQEVFNQNYDRPIYIGEVSKQLGVSGSHLTKLFKQYLGLAPVQYLSQLRISRAEELLGQGGRDILEISALAGFKSLSNFYKRLKEQTGHTPGEYRKNGGGACAGLLLSNCHW